MEMAHVSPVSPLMPADATSICIAMQTRAESPAELSESQLRVQQEDREICEISSRENQSLLVAETELNREKLESWV
jgi:hypothetical protein